MSPPDLQQVVTTGSQLALPKERVLVWLGSWLAQPAPRLSSPRTARLVGLVGGGILVGMAFLAITPQIVAPYDPHELVGRPLSPPGEQFWLGTNDIGQDLFSELIWGTRLSLWIGLAVASISLLIGTSVGLVTGSSSGWISEILMRLVDLTLALPFLPLVILISAYLGPGSGNIVLVLALVSWAGPARLIRAQALAISERTYIEAARAMGGSRLRILAKHIWPGVRPIALAQFVLVASASILAETSLSFLGLGDPSAKSWGSMLYFARTSGAFLGKAWRWWVAPTGGMICLLVVSLALIGHTLEGRYGRGDSR